MACSLDGTLAYLEFTVAELGKSMTDQEKVNYQFFSLQELILSALSL